jgi:hypothetical protein
MVFAIRGEAGAAALEVSTGWFLPNALGGLVAFDVADFPEGIVGVHSPTPIQPGLKRAVDCSVLGTKVCWGIGSSIAGRYVIRRMLLDGDAAVWEELEELYSAAFQRGMGTSHIEALQAKGRTVTY